MNYDDFRGLKFVRFFFLAADSAVLRRNHQSEQITRSSFCYIGQMSFQGQGMTKAIVGNPLHDDL